MNEKENRKRIEEVFDQYPDLLKTGAVMNILRVSRGTIWNWRKAGLLKVVGMHRNSNLYRKQDVRKMLRPYKEVKAENEKKMERVRSYIAKG